jgi:lipopolysaccharide exporter
VNKLVSLLNKKIPSGSLLRNVITLMTGTTFAQALLVLVAPILTRLYEPAYFGSFSMYISILSILVVISCLRYELAIVLPKKKEDAANILFLSIVVCIVLSVAILISIFFWGEKVSILLGAPELKIWLWFLPLSFLLAGLFQAFNYWNTRGRHFNRLAMRQITQSTATASAQISLGLTPGTQSGGLIIGHIFGQIAATGRLIYQTWKEEGRLIICFISKNKVKENLIKYKNFPLYSSWSGLLNSASIMMPPLLLGYFFTPTVVGFYALGQRVLSMPMNIVGNAVAQAFFPHASEANRIGNLESVTFIVYKNLLSLGLVPLLLISLIAPELFAVIFGKNWYEAGEYVRWMSIWLFFVFISSPLSIIYSVLERQKLGLIMDLILFISRLAVLIIGGLYGGPLLTIALFGIVGALLWMVNCLMILSLAGVPIYKTVYELLKELFKAIPYSLITILLLVENINALSIILSAIVTIFIFLIFQIRKVKFLLT